MDNFDRLKHQIDYANSIAILTHINPDGDAIGSSLALKKLIEGNFDKKTDLIVHKIPEIYTFLPDLRTTIKANLADLTKKYDLAIAVDVALKDRMGTLLPLFQNANSTINIDHHVTNNDYGILNYNSPSACSAGQVVYEIAKYFEWEMTKDIAECLYTSICTDTGNFKYDNTTSATLKMAAELIDFGVNPSYISRECYGSKPKEMVMLTAYAMSKAIFEKNDKIAYTVVLDSDLKKFNAKNEHTEGIVENLREIKTTEIAILIKEITSEQVKISMRSKNVDVSKISEKFNGGGHKFAAGCTINKPVSIATEKILTAVKETL